MSKADANGKMDVLRSRLEEIDYDRSRTDDIQEAIERAQRSGMPLSEDLALQRMQLRDEARCAGEFLLARFIDDAAEQDKELVLVRDPRQYQALLGPCEQWWSFKKGPYDASNYVLFQHPDESLDMNPIVMRYCASRVPVSSQATLGDVVRFYERVQEQVIPVPIRPEREGCPRGRS